MKMRYCAMFSAIVLALLLSSAQACHKENPAQAINTKSQSKPASASLWRVDDGGRPKAINLIQPKYTPEARSKKVEGTIYVEVTIDENGNVIKAQLVRGLKPDYGLNDACIKALLASTFSAAVFDGQKVKSSVTYPFTFKLDDPHR